MCGIVGFCARDTATVDIDALEKATASLRHRGPNDEGYVLIGGAGDPRVVPAAGRDTDPVLQLPPLASLRENPWKVGLGFRRLSILDLTTAGHQPMRSANGRYWIAFNGEIYNYRELRRELESGGATFHSGSDTEVLLEAYRQWGEAMLPRLIGMFAFGIVDTVGRSMLLARDPFGIKPLYFAETSRGLAFASEMKALLQFPEVTREADPLELYRFLRFGIVDGGSATMFRGIRQLAGGRSMKVSLSDPVAGDESTFWQVRLDRRSDLSRSEAAIELRRLFNESVALHMRSDVPIGACLSGGLDSTSIVSEMRNLLGPGQSLHTFSFLTDDPLLNESKYVDLVSREVGSISHTVAPRPGEMVEDLDALITAQDQPFGSTSIYAQYRVFKLAHEAGITVILDGQGSDEFFGGYNTAISAQIAGLLSCGRFFSALELSRSGKFVSLGARKRIILSAVGRLLPAPLAAAVMPLVGESLMPAWLSGSWFEQRGLEAEPRTQGRGRGALLEELALFTSVLSLPQLLRVEDRSSMHFSIESRVPFCIPAIADLAFSLPADYLVRYDGTTKAVLRDAVADLVPPIVLKRTKVGFSVPESAWLNQLRPWIEAQLHTAGGRGSPFVNRFGLSAMVESQLSAHSILRPSLWRLLNVLRWAELYGVEFA